ncbi:GGDEF domain-containing protein, partial [Thioalkalivibrio denitrificans]
MSDQEQWKLKYLDTIRQLESEAEQIRVHEGILRRLTNHLCVTARGQNARLDGVLDELSEALKSDTAADGERLESFIARMQMAVRGAGPDTPARPGRPIADADAAPGAVTPHEIVNAMLEQLPPVPGLRDELEQLLERLDDKGSRPDWPTLLSGMADVLREQCLRAQRERRELESFLKEVTDRLGEFDAFLTGHEDALDTARGEGAALEMRIRDEVQDLHNDMAVADSLDQLRGLVSEHLDAISEHVRGFRELEERRCQDHKMRAERLRQRIVQLEHETQSLRRTMEDERQLALVDQLTGIPNRQAFDERMRQEYSRWKRFGTPLTLLIWDVDNFKAINDSYGHKAGDKVIRAVAQALHKRVRETDFAARYGGEEFVMLLSGAAGHEALGVAEGIRSEIQALGFHFRGDRVPITISAGLAAFGE